MQTNTLTPLHTMVWTGLMAALIAVGSYIHIPLGPVPVSLQTFFVLLAGYALGPAFGALAVFVYLVAGAVGLPVFAGGASGLGPLLGPTGGYLIAFCPAAALCGLAGGGGERSTRVLAVRAALLGLAATAVIYAVGVTRLKFVIDVGWLKAATVGMFPFLPGDAVKLALAVAAFLFMRKNRLLPR